jgi:hypothetical protein
LKQNKCTLITIRVIKAINADQKKKAINAIKEEAQRFKTIIIKVTIHYICITQLNFKALAYISSKY